MNNQEDANRDQNKKSAAERGYSSKFAEYGAHCHALSLPVKICFSFLNYQKTVNFKYKIIMKTEC